MLFLIKLKSKDKNKQSFNDQFWHVLDLRAI